MKHLQILLDILRKKHIVELLFSENINGGSNKVHMYRIGSLRGTVRVLFITYGNEGFQEFIKSPNKIKLDADIADCVNNIHDTIIEYQNNK